MSKEKGKLIVITGPDGCGKKTQTELLMRNLKQNGYDAETIDFPQYEKNFFGKMVGRYLKGEFGKADELNPYLASILYAGDRFESAVKINNWLAAGKIVVCDRYAGDNFLHQGSKIYNDTAREEFFKWLDELEYKIFNVPRAFMTFYLDVPLKISLKLLENKDAKERKRYAKGKEDGHENEKHLKKVRKINNELIQKYAWIKIDCAKNGKLMPAEEIVNLIWNIAAKKLK